MTTMKLRIDRRAALGLIGGSALVPVLGAKVSAQTLDKVSYQTNWRAQAEHGGFYQAVASGIYKKYGIEADIRMGGPQQNPSQLLIGGAVDMIMSGGFEQINMVREGLPFITVASCFQKDPQVIICHPGVGNDGFDKLKGKAVLIGAGGRTSFWPFLRAKYGYTDDQIRPYTFNMAPFLADKNICQQGYVTSEPYAIEKEGKVKTVNHLIADGGFENYSTTVMTSKKMVAEKKDVVARFVTATMEGWALYMKNGEATKLANTLIQKDNPDMSDDKIEYAIKTMNALGIVKSGDADKLGIGAMTDARWASFYGYMADAGVFPKGLDVKTGYTLDFCNKGVGL